MKEQEAIEILTTLKGTGAVTGDEIEAIDVVDEAMFVLEQYREIGTPEELKQLKENGAFTGLELAQIAIGQMKLKEYQAICTVEECREAVEKMKPKKVIDNTHTDDDAWYQCPTCKADMTRIRGFNCCRCGQKLEW